MLIEIITIILGAILLVMLAFIQYRRLLAMRAYRMQTGNTRTDPKEEWLIGKVGVVKSTISSDSPGRIHVQGAHWQAVSESEIIEAGEKVRVIGFQDKMLVVSPVSPQ